jgi:hypothetical protein
MPARSVRSGETGASPSDGVSVTAGTDADGAAGLVRAGEAPMARASRPGGGRQVSQQAIRPRSPHSVAALPARNPSFMAMGRSLQNVAGR